MSNRSQLVKPVIYTVNLRKKREGNNTYFACFETDVSYKS